MKKPYQTEHEFISYVLMNNQDAINMANELFFISQIWDDLVDGDKPVDAATINRMMWVALIDLPLNAFYQLNFCALHPIVRASIMDWMVATETEKTGEGNDLLISYILRDTLTAILCHMAYLIGGYDWMIQVSADVRRWVHDEDFKDYVALIHEDRQRKEQEGTGDVRQ